MLTSMVIALNGMGSECFDPCWIWVGQSSTRIRPESGWNLDHQSRLVSGIGLASPNELRASRYGHIG